MSVVPFPRGKPAWFNALLTDAQAEPRNNVFNALMALRQDAALADLLHYDLMLRLPMLFDNNQWSPLRDTDVTAMLEYLQGLGMEKLGHDTLFHAVLSRARENEFHPVRNWLRAATWDGNARVAAWLHTYLGAEDNEYHRRIGTMFLISMVARVFEPGCQCDYMMILEGPQGSGKSTACRILAGQWFSDRLPSIHDDAVRVSQHLRGKWLIEIAEMSAMNKAEAADLKAFITSQVERFTPKFGRNEVIEPRQCVLIGTTNKHAYLRDETGGRRFWPVVTTDIRLDLLAADREQLFAEAVYYFHKGTQWYPDAKFEAEHIVPVQASRYQGDAWDSSIATWNFTDAERDSNGRPRFDGNGEPLRFRLNPPYYLIQIASGALHIDPGRLSKADEMRLAKVLESSGWQRCDKTMRGRPWLPPTKP